MDGYKSKAINNNPCGIDSIWWFEVVALYEPSILGTQQYEAFFLGWETASSWIVIEIKEKQGNWIGLDGRHHVIYLPALHASIVYSISDMGIHKS